MKHVWEMRMKSAIMQVTAGCSADGKRQPFQERMIAAHRMVDFKNDQDLSSQATGASATCLVPPRNYEALDALASPNFIMQFHVNIDHDDLSGKAIADALQVGLRDRRDTVFLEALHRLQCALAPALPMQQPSGLSLHASQAFLLSVCYLPLYVLFARCACQHAPLPKSGCAYNQRPGSTSRWHAPGRFGNKPPAALA